MRAVAAGIRTVDVPTVFVGCSEPFRWEMVRGERPGGPGSAV